MKLMVWSFISLLLKLMKIVILDFTDGKVKIVNTSISNLTIEQAEKILNDLWFRLKDIEYMIVESIEIEKFEY